jgi:glutamate--cysteine ligase
VRIFDALPTPFWQVAVAVTHALLTAPHAHAEVLDAVDGTTQLWVDAAQLGLGHPQLLASAKRLLPIAIELLDDAGHDPAIVELVAGYADRWSSRGRTPADDRLDAWRRDGMLVPERESPVPYGRELARDLLIAID